MSTAIDRLQAVLGAGYRVDREVGRGGMATVYLVHDLRHSRKVAVKVLHPGLDVIGGAERFQREIEIAASLSHPNVLPLLDSGSADGLRYYIMPFVEGESLRQRLEREHQLPLAEALRIIRLIAAGLHHAHQKGLVHRDIKPENILLTEEQVLVTDFGIARMAASNENLTATGFSLGTPNYMSPEQAMTSRTLDARSDLYSLACVCYELIAGHPPFMGSSWQEVMGRHAIDSVPSLRSARPSVPPTLERTLERALAKTPADRYDTVADFVTHLPSDQEIALSLTGAGAARPAAPPARPRLSRRMLIGALVGAVATIGALVWYLATRDTVPVNAAADRVLLAVLPLENIGPADDEYFADGLAEEIATRLSRVRGIGVIARNNRIRLGAEETVTEVGTKLGVRYVLGGKVQWARARDGAPEVRVTPSLVDVATGISVWGESFTAVLANVFDLQTRISLEVVNQLQIQLGASENAALRRSATQNVEAYRLYSLGRYHWKKRTPQGLSQAVDAFERALAADPQYARAQAGLADAYILYPQYGVTGVDGAEAFRRARAAATRALELDPQLAEAHASLAEIATYADWDWRAAEEHFLQAISLDPDYATAHHWYSELLSITGRPAEALEQGETALGLDPTSAVIAHAAAHPLLALRRFPEAIAAYQRVLDRDSSFSYARTGMLWAAVLAGNRAEAERMLVQFGDTSAIMRAWVEGATTPRAAAAARETIRRQAAEVAALPAHLRASIYAGVGMNDEAIGELQAAAAQHHFAVLGIKSLPIYDPLRSDPRFIALVAQLGLPPD